jgi:hypothetical protein
MRTTSTIVTALRFDRISGLFGKMFYDNAGAISLLFHLGRQLASSRILIVEAYCPEEVALGRPASPLLAGGLRGGGNGIPSSPWSTSSNASLATSQ